MLKDLTKLENTEKSLSITDLGEYTKVGMSKVDPNDIRPPQIILVQKSSDLSLLEDKDGNIPKVGQFYHTGKKIINDSFVCHILFAAKSKYTNRRQTLPDGSNPVLDQYQIIGVLKDMSLFGMNFRSTALFALSSLFTAVQSQNLPMFSFNVEIENKSLKGDKGEWFVPVVRVGKVEEDTNLLKNLLEMASRFDSNADKVASSISSDEEETIRRVEENKALPQTGELATEEVPIDEIPF